MNLHNTIHELISKARQLRAALENVQQHIQPMPDGIDMISAIFRSGHAINDQASHFVLDQVAFFSLATKSILNLARQENLCISSALEVSLNDVLDDFRGLLDVLILCDLTSHFDHLDDFTRIAQRLLGTARYQKLCQASSLEATLSCAQEQLRGLIDLLLSSEQAPYLHLVPRDAAGLVRSQP